MADEAAVVADVTGRKLVEDGKVDVVVVVPAGLPNESGALVVVTAVVDNGVENGKAGAAAVVVAVLVVAGVNEGKDGAD